MGHFTLHLLARGRFCPKGYFCWHPIVIIGFCAKNVKKAYLVKTKGWLFSYDFLQFKVKKALSTTLLFEKCQTADLLFFLSSY
jgi:hypothetical protein